MREAEAQYQDLIKSRSDPDLTISLHESTVDQLKKLSWDIVNDNKRTYDELVLLLIRTFRKYEKEHDDQQERREQQQQQQQKV